MPGSSRSLVCLSWLLQGAAALLLSACGGSPESVSPDVSAAADIAGRSGLLAAIRAAKIAAANDPLCDPAKLGDFYWEIGDATSAKPLVSNAEGGATVTASSRFGIASASKFVFGAYVLEKKGIEQVRKNPALHDGLRFMSGYTNLTDQDCFGKTTVGGCFSAGSNSAFNPAAQHLFYYNGGHDQKLAAVDLGLSGFTSKQLDREYQMTLGLGAGITMAPLVPLMAGGLQASASDYAVFLRKLMNRELVLGSHLGEDAVCALPSLCPEQAMYSPITALNEPWSYSYNHWVESEKGGGTVDAYSSPGKFGFYPWITPDRKFYGILSRHDTQPVAYGVSVQCGRQIRKAFLGALRQTS